MSLTKINPECGRMTQFGMFMFSIRRLLLRASISPMLCENIRENM